MVHLPQHVPSPDVLYTERHSEALPCHGDKANENSHTLEEDIAEGFTGHEGAAYDVLDNILDDVSKASEEVSFTEE